jgi:hypothetical protein
VNKTDVQSVVTTLFHGLEWKCTFCC